MKDDFFNIPATPHLAQIGDVIVRGYVEGGGHE